MALLKLVYHLIEKDSEKLVLRISEKELLPVHLEIALETAMAIVKELTTLAESYLGLFKRIVLAERQGHWDLVACVAAARP